jgi:hypothetical protein
VTKGIPFSKIEVRPEDQIPQNSFEKMQLLSLSSPSKKASVSLPLPYTNVSPVMNSGSLAAAAMQAQRQLEGISSAKNRDGIHQIVSRFLERFCYMCPLLFSCVFPSKGPSKNASVDGP